MGTMNKTLLRYQQGEKKTATTKMTDKNGLRMKKEMTMKE